LGHGGARLFFPAIQPFLSAAGHLSGGGTNPNRGYAGIRPKKTSE
jgi:hypothetical protein